MLEEDIHSRVHFDFHDFKFDVEFARLLDEDFVNEYSDHSLQLLKLLLQKF